MISDSQLFIEALQRADLVPVVAQVLGNPRIELLDWQLYPVAGVIGSMAGGGLGLFRLAGSATADGSPHPWSVIVKMFSGSHTAGDPTGTMHLPSAWNYWEREILAYRSGILAELPGQLVAPRCYGITEHPGDEWRLWLEDIQETATTWSMERHGIAARHLGQFNGIYRAGHALPATLPWMYRGRARDWLPFAVPLLDQFRHYARSASGRRWLTEQSVEQVARLMESYPSLLMFLDRLPVCLCHHDAFRSNLLARDNVGTAPQTVAIDWSMLGYGAIGEDIGQTIAAGLARLDIVAEQAHELDQIIFESYLDGLRDSGWQGDPRSVRFAYTVTAALGTAVAWMTIMGVLELSKRDDTQDARLDQWAIVHPFLLELGDEALRLMDVMG